MKLLAKTQKGKEFIYERADSGICSNNGAKRICDGLNSIRYKCKNDDQIWWIYDVDIGDKMYIENKYSIYRNTISIEPYDYKEELLKEYEKSIKNRMIRR